jgi:hypothetical protein
MVDGRNQEKRKPLHIMAGQRIKIDSARKTTLSARSTSTFIFSIYFISLGLPVLPHSQGLKTCIAIVHRVMVRMKT